MSMPGFIFTFEATFDKFAGTQKLLADMRSGAYLLKKHAYHKKVTSPNL
jgi:hypothetical protein